MSFFIFSSSISVWCSPMILSISFPFLKTMSVGIERTLNFCASFVLSSTLTLAKWIFPLNLCSSSSTMGAWTTQGMHHSAKKSTTAKGSFSILLNSCSEISSTIFLFLNKMGIRGALIKVVFWENYCMPEEPKPEVPRTVSVSAGTSLNSTVCTG